MHYEPQQGGSAGVVVPNRSARLRERSTYLPALEQRLGCVPVLTDRRTV